MVHEPQQFINKLEKFMIKGVQITIILMNTINIILKVI